MANNNISPRAEWQRTEGFALYTDVNDQLLDSLDPLLTTPPITGSEVSDYSYFDQSLISENPSAASLFMIMKRASQQVASVRHPISEFDKNYGINGQVKAIAGSFTFDGGFGDLNFPWHLSAGVANAAVDHFVDKEIISKDQKDRMALQDWATVIGSGWFSRLNHELALSSNGTYGSFGSVLSDYKQNGLLHRLRDRALIAEKDELFEYKEQVEPDEGLVYATVGLSRVATQGLRQSMKARKDSVGCPVARYSVKLSSSQIASNRHVKALLDSETIRPVPERSDDSYTRATQDYTAIDKTLAFFAMQIDNYADAHGTPKLIQTGTETRLRHSLAPPVDALRWPVKADQN